MKINQIDTDQQVFIVAEIGNNHEGDLDVAQELIRQAAKAGADAVKFQTYLPELYVSSEDQERLERLREWVGGRTSVAAMIRLVHTVRISTQMPMMMHFFNFGE